MIIQKWRFSDWPEEHYGTVSFVLKSLNQTVEEEDEENKGEVKEKQTITTKVFFCHEAVPIGKTYDNALLFWQKFWKTFRGPKGEIAPAASTSAVNKLMKKPSTSIFKVNL